MSSVSLSPIGMSHRRSVLVGWITIGALGADEEVIAANPRDTFTTGLECSFVLRRSASPYLSAERGCNAAQAFSRLRDELLGPLLRLGSLEIQATDEAIRNIKGGTNSVARSLAVFPCLAEPPEGERHNLARFLKSEHYRDEGAGQSAPDTLILRVVVLVFVQGSKSIDEGLSSIAAISDSSGGSTAILDGVSSVRGAVASIMDAALDIEIPGFVSEAYLGVV